jgi:pimeloyl-ACP methyl ester carboxylesterase
MWPMMVAMAMHQAVTFSAGLGQAALRTGRVLVVALVAGGLIFVGGLTQLGLNDYLRPNRTIDEHVPSDLDLPYRDAPLLTSDGLHLAAWFIPGSEPDALILVHGLGANRAAMLRLAADLHARGYSLLLPDLRAHGRSQGDVSTLGVKEVRDIQAAVAYLSVQPEVDPDRIGIYGGSLGGAVALLAAEQIPALRSVVVDSTFASARWVIDHQLGALLNLPDWFGFLLLNLGGLEAGISADAAAPARAAARLGDRPLLVIHGTEDPVFQVENAQLIFDSASGPRDLWILPGVGHTGAYAFDRPAYVARLDAFFQRGLEARPPLAVF